MIFFLQKYVHIKRTNVPLYVGCVPAHIIIKKLRFLDEHLFFYETISLIYVNIYFLMSLNEL